MVESLLLSSVNPSLVKHTYYKIGAMFCQTNSKSILTWCDLQHLHCFSPWITMNTKLDL